jgi:F-type H+-transporting ATPase subunit a
MIAGHILLEVFGSFIVSGANAGLGMGVLVGVPSFF